MTYRSVYSE